MATQTPANDESPSFFLRLIQNHYKSTPPVKSSQQISREEWLIPGAIRFSRWFCMPAAFIIQFCVGSMYSWSVFNKAIDNLIYGSIENMAPVTFYIAVGLLGFSAALMGPVVEKSGPKFASILGGALFGAGHLLTALALYWRQLWLVYLGYGVIGGLGIGLCYISPVSVLQKWFPDKRGLASGISVAGFGAGSIVSAKVEVYLLDKVGLSYTFIIIGVGYFIFIFLSGLVLRTPPPGFSPGEPTANTQINLELAATLLSPVPKPQVDDNERANSGSGSSPSPEEWELLSALTSTDFRLMYVAFLANLLFGLVAISRLSNMATDIFGRTPEQASTVVALNGACNLSGRILFPLLGDYIGRKNAYLLKMTIQICILIGFYFITTTKIYWVFVTSILIISVCYGGGLGGMPALLTDKFGQSNVGTLYGIILTAWSLTGVGGGVIFTIVFKATSGGRESSDPFPYNVNAWWMLGVLIIGTLCMMMVKSTKKDWKVYRALGLPCAKNTENRN